LLLRDDDRDWEATIDGDAVSLAEVECAFVLRDATDGHWHVEHEGLPHRAADGVAARAGDVVWVSFAGELFVFRIVTDEGKARGSSRAQDALTPPMPATVVRVAVNVGDAVSEGDTVVVLEAMKMELAIRSPMAGTVRAVHCKAGDLVQPGVVLLDID
jgi:3-methylcrotonyl-CoA carboxylase alpha subunit